MAPTIPSSWPRCTRFANPSSRVAPSHLAMLATTRRPLKRARNHLPVYPASRPQSISTATMAIIPSTTPMTVLAPCTAAILRTAHCTRARSRALDIRTTRKLQIEASAADRGQSLVARATALLRGAARDMRNRLQIPVVSTDFCTGRFAGCLISYSGLVSVLREGLERKSLGRCRSENGGVVYSLQTLCLFERSVLSL